MMKTTRSKRWRWRGLTAAALALGLSAPALAFTLTPNPPASVGERIHVAQSAESAQLAVRIQQLEEQIRDLTGQVQGLTFQLTQMQTLIERMQEDNEFRFQQLEGGGGGESEAVTPSGGATPAGESPQEESEVPMTDIPEQGVRPLPGEVEIDPTFNAPATPPASGDQSAVGTPPVGESSDPLLGTGQGQAPAVLGELPVERPPIGEAPLNLSFNPEMADDTGNPDADAQFTAAYEALQRGETEFAEDQFRQFVALYPDNPRAADAANWLGETLLARGANEEAAEVLLDAYTTAPNDPRAPDLLLRIGIALSRAGERETACRTLNEIPHRFANLTDTFRARLDTELANAECPPA